MEEKVIGLCPDFIIHPGETLLEIMEDNNMTKNELAIRCGVSPTHIGNVIKGIKDISITFAKKLEYVFNIDASFWINLQANYDKEIIDYQEKNKISNEEKSIVNNNLKQIINYLQSREIILNCNDSASKVIEMRKFTNISDLTLIPKLSYSGAYRVSTNTDIDVYVLYVWQCLCEFSANKIVLNNCLDVDLLKKSLIEIKSLMFLPIQEAIDKLRDIFAKCGIAFCVIQNFSKAPVQGFIKKINGNNIMLCLTIRQAFADIFWFTLFHEIAHIINEDYRNVLIDYNFTKDAIEEKADKFARDILIPQEKYNEFINKKDFSLNAIRIFSNEISVKPYIVIGRLQKERFIGYNQFASEKARFKWVSQ